MDTSVPVFRPFGLEPVVVFAVCAPLTNRREAAPSFTTTRCVQTLASRGLEMVCHPLAYWKYCQLLPPLPFRDSAYSLSCFDTMVRLSLLPPVGSNSTQVEIV